MLICLSACFALFTAWSRPRPEGCGSNRYKSGKRWIELPDRVLDILNAHNKAQLELRLQLVLGKSKEDAFVFCNHVGTPISPNYFSIMWSRELKRAALPKRTFHSLRHGHASELIRAGLDVVRVVGSMVTADRPLRSRPIHTPSRGPIPKPPRPSRKCWARKGRTPIGVKLSDTRQNGTIRDRKKLPDFVEKLVGDQPC